MLVHYFLKIKKGIQKFKETGDTKYIYKNELDKACFQHDMAYECFKNLARRTVSEKVLKDKAFNIAKNPNMMDIKEVLLLWFINYLIKHLQVVVSLRLKMKLNKINNLQMNFIN